MIETGARPGTGSGTQVAFWTCDHAEVGASSDPQYQYRHMRATPFTEQAGRTYVLYLSRYPFCPRPLPSQRGASYRRRWTGKHACEVENPEALERGLHPVTKRC